mmetsp:Transcript_9721/g.20012  ORF Transcript_9721/g.20012 Transcript_9721/m.20012 type:complete len:628 (+) Transcript_9721:76-1959(+)
MAMRPLALNVIPPATKLAQCLRIVLKQLPKSSLQLTFHRGHHGQPCSSNRRHCPVPPSKRRVVVTGLGAITPLGPDMKSTWKSVLRPSSSADDELSQDQHRGITTLYHALKEQDLTASQLDHEWHILQSSSCQVAASVPSEWINNHPNLTEDDDSPPSWIDGRTSRFIQLALIAAREAMSSSGLDKWLESSDEHDKENSIPAKKTIDNPTGSKNGSNDNQKTQSQLFQSRIHPKRRHSIGVSLGNGMSSTRDIFRASALLSANEGTAEKSPHRKITPHFVPQILPNSPSARVALEYGLMGPNLSHSEACAAGACAIGHAVELIRSGKADGMLAGGSESAVEALGVVGFGRLRALSTTGGDGGIDSSDANSSEQEKIRNQYIQAQKSSRPFDSQRNGFVLSEGAAILVLEEYHHAKTRGAPILAEVLGVGYSGDAFHITAPEPEGTGAARAMVLAVEDAAGCSSHEEESPATVRGMEDVDYVNAHATSTPIGDIAEVRAIRLALSMTESGNNYHGDVDGRKPLLLSSTKGATGHLLGAAGAIEAALTVLAVSEDTVPATRNLISTSDDIAEILKGKLDGDNGDTSVRGSSRPISLVQDKPMKVKVDAAMSNSFGFGGTNVSLLIGKAM